MSKEDIEVIKAVDKPMKGLRKGMTPRKILKSMTEDDWARVDMVHESQERELTNPYAMELFIESDAGVVNMKQIMSEMDKGLISILQARVDIDDMKMHLAGASDDEEKYKGKSNAQIEVDIKLAEHFIEGFLNGVRMAGSQLYSFVGTMKLDRSIKLTEDEYNAKIESVEGSLKGKGYSLFKKV